MYAQVYNYEEQDQNMLDTKETTEIFANNESKNYYKEALEKEQSMQNQQILEDEDFNEDSDQTSDKENNSEAENVPTINNMQEQLPTAHFGMEKSSKPKKKSSKLTKVSKGKKQYQFLSKLKMKLIERKENKYHTANAHIRRDEKWSEAIVLRQKVLFDLGSMAMLSKIHFYNMKVACLNVYVAENRKGPFVKVCDEIKLPHGTERWLKVGKQVIRSFKCALTYIGLVWIDVFFLGGLPWRYMMLEMVKGAPLREAYKNIELYGIYYKNMDSVLGDGFQEMLFDHAYEMIYHTKNLAE